MAIDRRSVIGLLAGGAAGTLATPILWKSIDDISIWSQNWPWIPRIPGYGEMETQLSVSKLDSANAAVQVLTVDGVPVQVYGDKEHPSSKGGISPLAASETQLLYSPSRVKSPMKKDGDTHTAISWDEALQMLADKLKEAGPDMAAVSGDEYGTAGEVFAGLAGRLGGKFYYMPSEGVDAVRATKAMGLKGQIGYEPEKADLILAVGADVFQSHGSYLAAAAAFNNARPAGMRPRMKAIAAVPAQCCSGAVADEFIPLAPGQEAAFLLELAAALAAKGAKLPGNPQPLKAVKPGETATALADKLLAARKPLVIAGGASGAGGGQAAIMLGAAINAALGAPMTAIPVAPSVVSGVKPKTDLVQADLVADLAKGLAPKVLLVHDANPAYALPGAAAQNVGKAGFVVSFSSFMDETAAMADLILPDSRPMEKFDDVFSPYGVGGPVYTLVRPVIKPVFDTKPAGEVALQAAAMVGMQLAQSYKAVLAAKAGALGAPVKPGVTSGKAIKLTNVAVSYAELIKAAAAPQGLTLFAVPQTKFGSAKVAIPPSSVVTIRSTELRDGEMFARLNGNTAEKAGVSAGQSVTLKSAAGQVEAKVAIDETVMDGVVAVPLGMGHTAWDEFSTGKGDNVAKLFTVTSEPGTGATVWSATPVEIA